MVIITINLVCLIYAQQKRRGFLKQYTGNAFHYMTNICINGYAHPCPRGQEIDNFGRPSLAQSLLHIVFNVSDLFFKQ